MENITCSEFNFIVVNIVLVITMAWFMLMGIKSCKGLKGLISFIFYMACALSVAYIIIELNIKIGGL